MAEAISISIYRRGKRYFQQENQHQKSTVLEKCQLLFRYQKFINIVYAKKNLTKYSNEGCPLTVQQHARTPINKTKTPVPTRTYGALFEKSSFSSRYLCSSTCIQMPENKITIPDTLPMKNKCIIYTISNTTSFSPSTFSL